MRQGRDKGGCTKLSHDSCFFCAGNEVGEPVIAERMIRIADNPVLQSIDDHGNHLGEREEEGSEEENDEEKDRELLSEVSERGGGRKEILHESSLPPLQVGSHPFSAMTADHDKERQDQITRSRPLTEEEAQIRQYVVCHIRSRDMLPVSPILLLLLLPLPLLPLLPHSPFHRYQTYLRRARTENFADIAGLGALYKAGRDNMGRQVVVYVGRLLPAPKVDLSKVHGRV